MVFRTSLFVIISLSYQFRSSKITGCWDSRRNGFSNLSFRNDQFFLLFSITKNNPLFGFAKKMLFSGSRCCCDNYWGSGLGHLGRAYLCQILFLLTRSREIHTFFRRSHWNSYRDINLNEALEKHNFQLSWIKSFACLLPLNPNAITASLFSSWMSRVFLSGSWKNNELGRFHFNEPTIVQPFLEIYQFFFLGVSRLRNVTRHEKSAFHMEIGLKIFLFSYFRN